MTKQIYYFFVAINCASCLVLETPQNTIAFVGQRMSLKCRTTKGFIVREWFVQSLIKSSEEKLFSNWKWSPTINAPEKYQLEVDKFGSGVLYSNVTQMEHAGRYRCVIEQNQSTQAISFKADLIVLAAEPECSTSAWSEFHPNFFKEETYLNIWCNISYAGNMVPVATLLREARKMPLLIHEENRGNESNWFLFNATFQLNSSDKGKIFSVEIHFEPLNDAGEMVSKATNIADYIFKWNFTAGVTSEYDNRAYSGHEWKTVVLTLGLISLFLLVVLVLVASIRLQKQQAPRSSRPNSSRSEETVCYAQVNKRETGELSSNIFKDMHARANANEVDPKDCIVYLDLNGVKGILPESQPVQRNHEESDFNKSEYASIDHTLQLQNHY